MRSTRLAAAALALLFAASFTTQASAAPGPGQEVDFSVTLHGLFSCEGSWHVSSYGVMPYPIVSVYGYLNCISLLHAEP